MIPCQKCKALNPDNFTFCQKCGTKLAIPQNTQSQKTCPFCGTVLEGSVKFCKKCGAAQDLSEQSQVQTEMLLDTQNVNTAMQVQTPRQEQSLVPQTVPQQAFYNQNPSKNKSNAALIVVLVCLAVFIAAGGGGLFYMYHNGLGFFTASDDDIRTSRREDDSDERLGRATPTPEPTESPEQTAAPKRTSTPKPTATPTPRPTATPTQTSAANAEYILPNSSIRYLTKADLTGLTAEQCRIARNEIYARHGRLFDDQELQEYFNSCSWYQGTIPAASFNDEMLSDIEKANRDLIVQYEQEQGYR